MRLMPDRALAVGHTSESAAHVVVCSPVAGLHLSEKAVNGIVTVDQPSPCGTLNLVLKQPRLKGMEPPPEHAYAAESVPAANETRKPVYDGVDERTSSTSEPPSAFDTSVKVPSAAALMKPGAESEGTSSTFPSITP